MIKKFRQRFIVITLLTLAFVEIVIIGTINGINLYNQNQEIDQLLTVLVENDGKFPDFHGKGENGNELKKVPDDEDDRPFLGGKDMNPETRYVTRYFVVTVDDNDTVQNTDTGHIAAIDSAQAQEYADKALESGKTKGYCDNYKFIISERDNEKMLIFVDCRMQIEMQKQFLEISVIIAVSAFVAFSLILVLVSKRAVKPYIEAMEKQKRFITDAGHEIKTPLAIISANNEVIEMISGKTEWTESINNQVKRLSELTKQLVSMAKMDEDFEPVFAEFNISDAVYDTASPFVTLAESKNKKARMDITDGIMYTGDEGMIRQAVSVLMDNAVKYADDGGDIIVSLKSAGKNINISVFNTCSEPPEGDMDLLFDRFYRADSSRSRETGGYGIGLSIAKSIVDIHKGKITAKAQNGGVIFEITLKK